MERLTVLRLGAIARNIRSISFIRPEFASSPIESAVEYEVHVTPEHNVNVSHDVTYISVIAQSSFHNASYGQMDPLPHAEHSTSWAVRRWPISVLSYVKGNHVAAAFAAGASGSLISEASRALYMRIQALVI